MKHLLVCPIIVLVAATSVRGAVTPLTTKLTEGPPTIIECELTVAPKLADVPVFKTAKECEDTKGTYHYQLHLPKGYNADAKRLWPCMFFANPAGVSKGKKIREVIDCIKDQGYIVIALIESKNGPWEPIIGNFLAAHDDAVKRVRIQEGLKMATGFSGGARASSIFVQLRPGFSGLILQGAGGALDDRGNYYLDGLKRNNALHTVIAMGKRDPNAAEVSRMKTRLSSARCEVLMFDGAHAWAPLDVMENAIAWIERELCTKGLVPRDAHPELLARLKSQAAKKK